MPTSSDPGVLASLGWIDLTALAILAVFCVLGLFRGFIWQMSRILTLILAYTVAGLYGDLVASKIRTWFPAEADGRLPLYVAYFGLFLIVLIVVGILAHFVDKLVHRAGLSFYNRLGGGLLGIATGACGVIALLAVVLMFFSSTSGIVRAAEGSHALTVSRQTLEAMSGIVPEPVLEVFGVTPAAAQGEAPPPNPALQPGGSASQGEPR